MSSKKLIFLFYFILFLPFIFNNFPSATASETNEYSTKLTLNKKRDNSKYNNYLLGPGDSLKIRYQGLEIFDGQYSIDLDGNLLLPEIDYFFAAGFTLEELKKELKKEYSKFIKDPEIFLAIDAYRPVQIYIKGQVRRPGLYTLNYKNVANEAKTNPTNSSFSAPTLFDALKISKGVNNFADLSKISVIRKNSISNGSGKIKANINLLSLLRDGDQTQNIRLMDEDIIVVAKSEIFLKKQIDEFNRSNLSQDKMRVYITGNVVNPGSIVVDNGSRLVQALYMAGGEGYWTGKINFIRLDEYGKPTKKSFRFNSKAILESKNNPVLMEGDIIDVNKNIIGKTTTLLKEVSSPIFSAVGITTIFD